MFYPVHLNPVNAFLFTTPTFSKSLSSKTIARIQTGDLEFGNLRFWVHFRSGIGRISSPPQKALIYPKIIFLIMKFKVIIKGKVHGVGYRVTLINLALEYGIDRFSTFNTQNRWERGCDMPYRCP